MKTPAPTAQRLSSPRQYRALRELLKGPRTVRELLDVAGGNGAPQLVDALRGKGLEITTTWHRGRDRDQRPVRFGEYALEPSSRDKAARLVEDYRAIYLIG